jgi:hypothetical protein
METSVYKAVWILLEGGFLDCGEDIVTACDSAEQAALALLSHQNQQHGLRRKYRVVEVPITYHLERTL